MSHTECITAEFGDYVLTTRLSAGGMAELFLATRSGSHLSQQVALKRMLPHLSQQKEFVTMFLDEARVASLLSHPNLVQVIDFGEVRGEYYLAMEYLPGETLSSIVKAAADRAEPLPLAVVLQVVSAVCDGLHHAHEFVEGGRPLGLVHRDVSPTNVMVTYHGGVKVLDFGIAYSDARNQEQTQAGVVKGKVPYCSPEQIEGKRLDRRSDIFSVGTLLYELLTGHRAFRRDSDFATSRAVVDEAPPAPSSLRPDLPRELDAVVARAMAKKPEARFGTCLELRRALDKLQQGPPVRLDDFMLQLFGKDRFSARVTPQASATPLPRPSRPPLAPSRLMSTPARGTSDPLKPPMPSRPSSLTPLSLTPSSSPSALTPSSRSGLTPSPSSPSGLTPSSSPSGLTPVKGPCPHTSSCALFPQFKLVSLLSVWKVSYCDSNYTKCVRFQMSKEGKVVSLALLPNGTLLSAPKKR